MAEPLTSRERHAFYLEHHGLREWAWASHFAHLDRVERACLRERLKDPAFEMPQGCPSGFRERWLEALDSLDLIDDPKPNAAALREAASVIERARLASH